MNVVCHCGGKIILGNYTSTVNILSHRSFLARLRGGTAPLAIETGGYIGVPAEERTCHTCYEAVGDEIHFLTSCKYTEFQRKILYEHIQKSHPEFHHLTNKGDKYICILHHANSSSKTAELISSWLAECTKHCSSPGLGEHHSLS